MDNQYKLTKKFSPVVKCFAWLGGFSIFFSMIYVTADILTRLLFKSSIGGGTDQLVSMITVFVAYMPLAYTMAQKGHVTMTIFTGKLNGKKKIINDMWVGLFCTVFFVVFFYMTLKSGFMRAYTTGEIIETSFSFKLYIWYGKIALPIGTLIMAVTCFLMFVDSLLILTNYNKIDKEIDSSDNEKEEIQ
jgi:TRAP-type C4-dicarboxylate transport system permease small subunit